MVGEIYVIVPAGGINNCFHAVAARSHQAAWRGKIANRKSRGKRFVQHMSHY